MKVRAQFAFVFNLDKCIGCHTCSVTCKNVWTNRKGVEYAWFNNVESKPGIGYPKNWADQNQWKGGWDLKGGKLEMKSGDRKSKLLNIFAKSLSTFPIIRPKRIGIKVERIGIQSILPP